MNLALLLVGNVYAQLALAPMCVIGALVLVLRLVHDEEPSTAALPHTPRRGVTVKVRRSNGGGRSSNFAPPPLFLLLGFANSGKTAFLEGLARTLPAGDNLPLENFEGSVARWRVAGAEVLEVAGDLLASSARGSAGENEWKRFVTYLKKRRPQRPLDGIILTVPCTELAGEHALDAQHLQDRAAEISQSLNLLCRQLGFSLPLYLVVSKCEAIPGYSTLVQTQLQSRLHEIFGWSNPYSLDISFSPPWSSQAFTEVNRVLQSLRVNFFAQAKANDAQTSAAAPFGDRPSPDEMFLFPAMLQKLQPTLAAYIAQLLQNSASLQFRGIYLSGSTATANRRRDDIGSNGARGSDFIADLFTQKILPERALARPVDGSAAHRNEKVFALRALCAIAVLLLFPGLFWRWHSLSQRSHYAQQSLERIQSALRQGEVDSAATPDAAYDAIYAVQALSGRSFQSVFLPASLIDSFQPPIQQTMPPAFTQIVYPGLRSGLEQQVGVLLQNPDQPDGGAETPEAISPDKAAAAATQQFDSFIDRLLLLQDNIVSFNNLTAKHGTGQDLLNIEKFLSPANYASLPSSDNSGLNELVPVAGGQPFEGRPWILSTVKQLESRLESVLQQRTYQVSNDLDVLQAQVAKLEDGKIENYDELQALNQSLSREQEQLKTPALQWLASSDDPPKLPSDLTWGISAIFTRKPAQNPLLCADANCALPQLQASVDQAGRASGLEFRRQLLSSCKGIGCALLSATDTQKQSSLQSTLANFLKLPFVAHDGMAQISDLPEQQVFWDLNRLQAALQDKQDYDKFFSGNLTNISATAQDTFETVGLARLQANMIDAVASAAQFQPDCDQRRRTAPGTSCDQERSVLNEAANFQLGSQSLGNILTQFGDLFDGDDGDQDDADDTDYRKLRRLITGHALLLLSRMDEAFKAHKFYWPPNDVQGCPPSAKCPLNFDLWIDKDPQAVPSIADYGVRNPQEMAAFLAKERQEVQQYSSLAQVPASFLQQHDSGKPNQAALIATWQSIADDLQKYSSAPATSGLGSLEDFLANGMNTTAPPECQIPPSAVSSLQLYFIDVRTSLERSLKGRCQVLSNQSACEKYGEIATFFNVNLKGGFPFSAVPPAVPAVKAEAKLSDVLELFQRLNADEKAIRLGMQISSPCAPPAKVRDITTFLDQIDALRPLFASLLSGQPGAVPALDFSPAFRVNRAHEANGDQIIDWTLETGDNSIHKSDPPPLIGHWTYGEPIKLLLRWAKNSPAQPVQSVTPTGGPPAGKVTDGTVEFEYDDPWSLLLLLQQHAAAASDFARSVDPDPHTLVFTAQVNSPVVGNHGQAAQADKTAATENVRVFVRLKIFAPGKTDSLPLPNFPSSAP